MSAIHAHTLKTRTTKKNTRSNELHITNIACDDNIPISFATITIFFSSSFYVERERHTGYNSNICLMLIDIQY